MKRLSLVIALFSLAISGCSGRAADSQNEKISLGLYDTSGSPASPELARSASNTGGGGGGREESPVAQAVSLNETESARQPAVPTDRKIIRNAELGLESDSPEETQKKVASIAEAKGGFVVESQQSSSDRRSSTRDTVTMTVRVPAEKFNEALDEIRTAAGRVVIETVKGQDVTEEFIDIEARLKAKRALEEQFMEIMKRANSVEDALNVQRQLAEVRGEIEKIEGRKRFLENQATLSTIKLRIQTPSAISASGAGFFAKLADSINTGIDAAMDFVLGLITFAIAVIPFILFIGLPAYLLIRYFWRKARRRKTAAEIADDEIKSE